MQRNPSARPEATAAASMANEEAVRATLCRVDEILRAAYGTPDLGNKVDPLDELLFLLIAQRTRIDLARKVYEDFRREFYPWKKVLRPENRAGLRRALSKGGRGNLRMRAVRELLSEISRRTGSMSLDFLRQYTMEDARKFLLSLPWVGEKTAYCVLLYSLGHPIFPVDSNIIRILRRTQVLSPVGVTVNRIDHRVAQKRVLPWVPAGLAYTLHVNMVVHGRTICVPGNPRCGVCPIRLWCSYYRHREYRSLSGNLTMIDLFSGAGGISYGFARAGIRPVLAVDRHVPSCETYRLNVPWIDPHRVVNADVTSMKKREILELLGKNNVDFLVAGVPCQGFSRVGLKSKPALRKQKPPEKEPINKLFMEVIRWAKLARPTIVLLENVPDMGRSEVFFEDRNVRVREHLDKHFRSMGYRTGAVYFNAADFGVPQVRKRLFFVAVRKKGLDAAVVDKILALDTCRGNVTSGRYLSFSDALRGLPALEAGAGAAVSAVTKDYLTERSRGNPYAAFVYDSPFAVFNNSARQHNEDDMRIVSALHGGETYKSLLSRRPDVVANRRMKTYSATSFHDKFFRLHPGRPSRTIVSHLAKDGNSFIHPAENRSITVREAARAQGFPDSFVFEGARGAQYMQVGNSVPPLVAYAIGAYWRGLLKGRGA